MHVNHKPETTWYLQHDNNNGINKRRHFIAESKHCVLHTVGRSYYFAVRFYRSVLLVSENTWQFILQLFIKKFTTQHIIVNCQIYRPFASMAEVIGAFKNFLSAEQQLELKSIAEAIVAPGKGILAADESTGRVYKFNLPTF